MDKLKHDIFSVANFVTHLIRLSLKFEKYKDKNVSEKTLLNFRNSFYRVLEDLKWQHNWTFCLCSDERFEDPKCINLFHETIVRACELSDLSVDLLFELLPPINFFRQDNRVLYKIGYTELYKFLFYGRSCIPQLERYKDIPEKFDYDYEFDYE